MTGLGWHNRDPEDPDTVALRQHLSANSGIEGLERVTPTDVARATELFHRDGFVVVVNALTPAQLAELHGACMQAVADIVALDSTRRGNRGSHRYSFGGSSLTRSMLHLPAWQMLVDLPTITPIVTAIFGSTNYMLRAASGDFCLPGAVEYQPLHRDMGDYVDGTRTPFSSFVDPSGKVTTRDLPVPYVAVNFPTVDITRLNGATRQIPGTQNSNEPIPTLDQETEAMRLSTVCPLPAGSAMIRDVRGWHGGTPNLSDHVRCIPNVEFYAPWFREPVVPGISFADHKRLSVRAQELTRYTIADSSEQLATGYVLGTTPRPRGSAS